ncbi:hypothetical protein ABZ747_17935 [Kitasatospora cineracea]|uniref:hypothetical protein n=1 Tax=Kitasatospora cineracea TaxID=88074 RepID=UPI003409BD37
MTTATALIARAEATLADHPTRELSTLLHAADLAMYADKGGGRRGRRRTFTPAA